MMNVSVLSGSEETKRRVHTCGNRALHHRDLHHSSDLSLPHGLALGVGLHPWVYTTLPNLSAQQMQRQRVQSVSRGKSRLSSSLCDRSSLLL